MASLSPVLGSCLPGSWGQGCPRILRPASPHHIADAWLFLDSVPLRSNPLSLVTWAGTRVQGSLKWFSWTCPSLLVAVGAHSSYFSLLVSFSQDWSTWVFFNSSREERNASCFGKI